MTDDYFIQIPNPDLTRKALLESSKNIIITLKQYHLLMSVRKSKLDTLAQLKDQLKELTFLLDKLNKAVPDRQIEYEKEIFQQAIQEPKTVPKATVPVAAPTPPSASPPDDMAKLERVLASIEQKLSNMK
jgi:polyhydroxyalkanoate synthesis regulator protein